MMNIEDFNYNLPEELIAQHPPSDRGGSKLLSINPKLKSIEDLSFKNFFEKLNDKDLLIFNDTRVMKARIYGKKISGGKVEILLERILNNNEAIALIKTSKKISVGLKIETESGFQIEIIGREKDQFWLRLNSGSFYELMGQEGHMPLPPYIDRADDQEDEIRYQTVFAKNDGAVAAPTAGLHFSDQDFSRLKDKNINFCFITLHVGSGTFQPIKTSNIDEHEMHEEIYQISSNTFKEIKKTKEQGGRIVAIGTTVLRALESAFQNNKVSEKFQTTKIFIKPGYQFKIVDALFTNFHLPKSTLLMLVSAFAGHEFIKKAYEEAILNKYRFFSYGDAMFIEQKDN
jgi:S-adenosylmethionine:tRNA ribosyltransferase-isomerase